MTCGVYSIRNVLTGDQYIGSSVSIESRWACHKSGLKHGNGSKHLQRAWNKYGEENFIFEVLEECEQECVRQLELKYFDKFEWTSLYNLSKKTTGGRGELSAEAKGRIAEATGKRVRGVPLSEEHKRKIGKAHKGKHLSEEHRKKVGDSKRGGKLTPEHRAKISKSLEGNQRGRKNKHV